MKYKLTLVYAGMILAEREIEALTNLDQNALKCVVTPIKEFKVEGQILK